MNVSDRIKSTFLVGIIFLGSASGCQSYPLKEFETITPGMEKNDVLGKIGSPSTSLRFHDKDRWIYVFYDEKFRFVKEVHFLEGNVVYIGDKWEPPT
jgi:outer membrane protein assembly factor BamE